MVEGTNEQYDGVIRNDVPLYTVCAGHQLLSEHCYPTHRKNGRSDYQIIYLLKGKTRLVLDGKEEKIGGGTVVIYRPNEPQIYTHLNEEPLEAYWVHFSGYLIKDIFEELKLNGIRKYNIGYHADLANLMLEMINCLILKPFGYSYILSSNLLKTFQVIAGEINAGKRPSPIYPDKLLDVITLMQNTSQKFNLKTYADMCNLSVSRFAHIFKDNFGLSPYQYQTAAIIKKAKEYLLNTELTIGEISDRLNFENVYYFSRLFKKYTNLSPNAYRKQFLNGEEKDQRI